ncbi:MAG: hypothetical protein ACRDYC_00480 [Acidimicrobiales bacterium]
MPVAKMELQALLAGLRSHHRLYLLDDRFASLVSLLDGYDIAKDNKALRGFQHWLAERFEKSRSSGYSWPALVARQVVPGVLTGELRFDQIPATYDRQLRETVISLIEEFLLVVHSVE